MKLSAHLDSSEIVCKCGCGRSNLTQKAINLFEAVRHELGDKPLFITSGCRCPSHSVAVGGYANDYHVKGMAFDVYGKHCTPAEICAAAEKCGANGVGLMNGAAHFDCGDRLIPWRGDERTGKNVSTFITKKETPQPFGYVEINGKKYDVYKY